MRITSPAERRLYHACATYTQFVMLIIDTLVIQHREPTTLIATADFLHMTNGGTSIG